MDYRVHRAANVVRSGAEAVSEPPTKVTRYTGPVHSFEGGGFVAYGDYLTLERERDAARAERDDLQRDIDVLLKQCDYELQRANTCLAERNEAHAILFLLEALQQETMGNKWCESTENDDDLKRRWAAAWKRTRSILDGRIKMKTIYAVNFGAYSDYTVVGLFSTKEKAQEFMDAVPYEYNEIEEYELDPDTANLVRKGYEVWVVAMLRDGTCEDVRKLDLSPRQVPCTAYIQGPHFSSGKNMPSRLIANVMAKDEKHAVKIANEKRVAMIASGEWD